ncbi:MAG: hypothetical protein WC599_06775 [Bacteroidales bacterium]
MMKKIFFLFTAIAFIALISCSGDSKKTDGATDSTATKDNIEKVAKTNGKYQLKSGIITMSSDAMGIGQTITLYFDDYGNKECAETKGEMDMGIAGKVQMHQLAITKDGYVYNIDMTNKSGTKTKITPNSKQKDIDFSNLTEDMMKQMKIKKEGTEVLLGKTCDKYSLDAPALKMKSSYSVWNGIPLKSEVNMIGIVAKITTTKIEENCVIPAEKFEIPKDIKITEVKGM